MFDKQRYLTRGISEKLSIPLQVTLWRMIEKVDKELDYLQVFEIHQLPDMQVQILHRQEEPDYTSEIIVRGTIPEDKLKVYVIDDGDYSTMLIAEEY